MLRVLCAVRISLWSCCQLLIVSVWRHWVAGNMPDMGALSWLNAGTLERAPHSTVWQICKVLCPWVRFRKTTVYKYMMWFRKALKLYFENRSRHSLLLLHFKQVHDKKHSADSLHVYSYSATVIIIACKVNNKLPQLLKIHLWSIRRFWYCNEHRRNRQYIFTAYSMPFLHSQS